MVTCYHPKTDNNQLNSLSNKNNKNTVSGCTKYSVSSKLLGHVNSIQELTLLFQPNLSEVVVCNKTTTSPDFRHFKILQQFNKIYKIKIEILKDFRMYLTQIFITSLRSSKASDKPTIDWSCHLTSEKSQVDDSSGETPSEILFNSLQSTKISEKSKENNCRTLKCGRLTSLRFIQNGKQIRVVKIFIIIYRT